MAERIRAFVLTQDEPFYIPKVIRRVLDHQGDAYEVVGATILKPHRKNKTMRDWARERLQIYTWRERALVGAAFACCVLHRRAAPAGRRGRFSVRRLLAERGIPTIETADVNGAAYVEALRALGIDVLLSISPPQIFKEDLLRVPVRCALNAHGTLLPRHRGVFGSWWARYCGDAEAGSTIHTMELRLDAGEIVWQQAFPLGPDDTQYSIAYRTKRLLAEGLVETLHAVHRGGLEPIEPRYEESYHRAPTAEEGRDFHRKGYRVLTLRDYRYMLAAGFGDA